MSDSTTLQMFTDLPALLNFYKVHYLDTTPLIRPATKRVEKVIGKYDFEGSVSHESHRPGDRMSL
jgi:proto-oncogene C-crk